MRAIKMSLKISQNAGRLLVIFYCVVTSTMKYDIKLPTNAVPDGLYKDVILSVLEVNWILANKQFLK